MPQARADRQGRLGDAVKRWHEEERRLFRLMKTFKERARYAPDWAKRADAMETRWNRFRAGGPPPSPVPEPGDRRAHPRWRLGPASCSTCGRWESRGSCRRSSEEIHFGERVGVIGPNGSGKSALIHAVAGLRAADVGELRVGPRVSTGYFTQLQTRADFGGRIALDIVLERGGAVQTAMAALARYGLVEAARRPYDVLSGGEKARLEVLILELEGHNLLLLDEPTDNLDTDSAEALETALDRFEGTVVAVSHDRAFLQTMDRYLMVLHDGRVLSLPSYDSALEAMLDPARGGRRAPGKTAVVRPDMRAYTLDALDSPPGLRTDLPEPAAAADEVVVRVRASSVNPVDGAIADGLLRDVAAHEFPVTLGRDYAGTVERAGDGVTGYRPGDEVFGSLPYADPVVHAGAWTELIAVPENLWIAPRPAGLDLAAAGALGLAGVTALACLDALRLGDGDTLLVIGATGGVGSLAVQLAARAGVPVVATGRGDDVEYLRELGATIVVDRDGDITEEVRPHHDVTAIIDLVSADPQAFMERYGALEAGGRAVSTLGAAGDAPGQANVMAVPSAENLARLARLAGDGELRVPVQRTYALEQAGEALAAAATTRTRGKLAVTIG